MMNRTALTWLGAIVAALLVALLVIEAGDRARDRSDVAFVDGLRAALNDVDRVVISRDGSETTIRRTDEGWGVEEYDGYAADVGKLRSLLIALADAAVIEEKTSNPERYDRLGVADPAAGGAGVLLTVTGPGVEHTLILGDPAGSGYRYARIADSEQSVLIDADPDIPAAGIDWLNRNIIDVVPGDVRRVSITHADGEEIMVERPDSLLNEFAIAGVPDGRELTNERDANLIAAALRNLELEDVRPAVDGDVATTTLFELADGTRITAEVLVGDEASWIGLSATASAPAIAPSADGGAAAEAGDAETAVAMADPVDADALNARHGDWQYRLNDPKLGLLTRRWADLLGSSDDAE